MIIKSVTVLVWLVHISNGYEVSNLLFGNHRRYSRDLECVLPPFPEYGKWKLIGSDKKPGDPVPTSTVIVFECQPGFKVTTESNLSVCIGQWTLSPDCERMCPPLYSSDNYQVKCSNKLGNEVSCAEATHGTILEYKCSSFFEAPFGNKRTLLCENGNWDHQSPVCQPVCGKEIENNSQKPEEKIKYPWVTAVYSKNGDDYENICGGSILSQTIVLTGAYCVTNEEDDPLPAENYLVGAGKLHRIYKSPEDEYAQYLEVSKIIIPQQYRGDVRLYLADLAVLVLKGEFVISQSVQPVCFTNMKNIRLHAGNRGAVSGWGLAEGNEPSEVLRSLEIPYKYEIMCADELPPEFADKYNLQDKICAGFFNQSTSVCQGDNGGGLTFKNEEDNRYYIHGVVSLAQKYNCDIQRNALYTKVASYYNFVENLLTKYAPKIRDCRLPSFPQNGRWTVDIPGMNPGDLAPSSTILNLHCSEGFRSATSEIECSSAHNMPTCEGSE